MINDHLFRTKNSYIEDGLALSRGRFEYFNHNNLADLKARIAEKAPKLLFSFSLLRHSRCHTLDQ
ncbi:Uncharacterised protein [Legionella israelensis]|uniref:Uncharacterized protein n=1 Tax=Legionella israelensis TaxID=454 RepID=A0A0W0WS58_9GAMM|nr:hypothetical protein [Legionella israelensis]KTD35154.1 hypothetical protein Lisr_0046 [Legionella israelensis]QBS08693.1 hypothetical protein E4T55_01760 [Legionella israelensis]SCY00882.1 hypothetical protein SAMN02746069_00972 [Legionella israelensis DSM 19235]STX58361.1 Uncharacterised protein [Legionella israelensis]